jgi:redox-sensitive bicupin YhaK (pirin superfamily)
MLLTPPRIFPVCVYKRGPLRSLNHFPPIQKAYQPTNLAIFSTLKSNIRSNLKSTLNRTMSTTSQTLKVTSRPWSARGHADHGWLYTFHTFSFASYHDRTFQGLGPLRVINEDRVARSTGFGTHPHAEYLIWSYIVAGELEHRDSLGNVETLRRGDVQFTSAGTGVRHSEYNRNDQLDNHFLQIWAKPAVRGLTPSYVTRTFPDARKQDRLLRVMESVARAKDAAAAGGADPAPIPLHADLSMDASILSPGRSVSHAPVAPGERKLYLHVVMRGREQPKAGTEGARIRVGGVELGEGDGAFVEGLGGNPVVVESVGEVPAEFLLFDVGEQ